MTAEPMPQRARDERRRAMANAHAECSARYARHGDPATYKAELATEVKVCQVEVNAYLRGLTGGDTYRQVMAYCSAVIKHGPWTTAHKKRIVKAILRGYDDRDLA